MSKESKVFLKETHLLIKDAVESAMHALQGSDFSIKDRLGSVLEEKDVKVLRNIHLSFEESEAIELLLKAVSELSLVGILSMIDGIMMSSEIDLPDLSLINRDTGLDITDEALLNEEFFEVADD
jgi:hypothetical protein